MQLEDAEGLREKIQGDLNEIEKEINEVRNMVEKQQVVIEKQLRTVSTFKNCIRVRITLQKRIRSMLCKIRNCLGNEF